jgi:predicted permease
MLGQDLKFAWRGFRRQPGFAAAIVLTLGLGIGANATVFSWLDAVALNPLPGVAHPEQLSVVRFATATRNDLSVCFLNYSEVRDSGAAGLDGLAAYAFAAVSMRVGPEPERVWAQMVTGNMFDVLKVPAALGRPLQASDEAGAGQSYVAVMSDALWRRRFNADPSIVGRPLILNGQPFTVVGVAPAGFVGALSGVAMDLFVPITMQKELTGRSSLEARGNGFLTAIARRGDGVSPDRLQAGLTPVAAHLAEAQPINEGRTLRVAAMTETGAASILLPVLSVVMVVVGLVLLIACANVSGLLLARAASRQREVAVRTALGATPRQLVRQLLVESLGLAIVGGVAGLLIAVWGSKMLDAALPPMQLPVLLGATVNWHVAAFIGAVVGLTTIVFGLAPAWHGARASLQNVLRTGGAGTGSPRRARLRRVLVIAQMAMAMVLLVGTGLFLRTLIGAASIDPGYHRKEAVMASLDVASVGYTKDQGLAFYDRLLARMRALPDVENASLSTFVPLGLSGNSDTSPTIEGYDARPNEEIVAYYGSVAPGYFDTMQIPIVAGRPIDERDRAATAPVVVINETMARRYWPGRTAVGGRMKTGGDEWTVVGVAKDGKYRTLGEAPRSQMYFALQQAYRSNPVLHVATRRPAAQMINTVRQAAAAELPELALFEVHTLEEQTAVALTIPSLSAMLLGIFGGLALTLAAIGLYRVVAFVVSQRTQEIGIRMALGANRSEVFRDVLGQGSRMAAIGLVIGAGLAMLAGPALSTLLVNVSPTDAVTYAGTALVLIVVALVASWLPARRAAGIDPVRALRLD